MSNENKEPSKLKVAIAQICIKEDDKKANLDKVRDIVNNIESNIDILVLPEVFNTGFSQKAYSLFEDIENDNVANELKEISMNNGIAIACSYFIRDVNKKVYNRFSFFKPSGEIIIQDKRHLFSIGNEDKYLDIAYKRTIIEYKGWNILPTICYDIRFPVWCRNKNNEYDIIINVSNWPKSRQDVLYTLLKCRAIENQCYVIGVNRFGCDSNGIEYIGGSTIFDYRGRLIIGDNKTEEIILSTELVYNDLKSFRDKFPVYKDADKFTIEL